MGSACQLQHQSVTEMSPSEPDKNNTRRLRGQPNTTAPVCQRGGRAARLRSRSHGLHSDVVSIHSDLVSIKTPTAPRTFFSFSICSFSLCSISWSSNHCRHHHSSDNHCRHNHCSDNHCCHHHCSDNHYR